MVIITWDDLVMAISTTVLNKKKGCMGFMAGRATPQKSMREGGIFLHAVQDVYLNGEVAVAYY